MHWWNNQALVLSSKIHEMLKPAGFTWRGRATSSTTAHAGDSLTLLPSGIQAVSMVQRSSTGSRADLFG